MAEQQAFEQGVRGALADLAARLEGERVARERAEDAIRALREEAAATEARAREEAAGLTAHLHESVESLLQRVAMLENRARADALERQAAATPRPADGGPAPATAGTGVPALVDFDYLGFENRFRGPEELVRARQERHAERLTGAGTVLDLGCGRGEFLELVEARGSVAVGVDSSAQMVALAREKGLDARHGDIFAFLAEQAAGSIGGILCSHVVEHLWPADHMRLARLCAAALAPGGTLIVETPNPKSLIAGSVNFPCDPTHLRPVFPETLAFMLESAGFADVRIEYLSPVPDDRRATPVTGAPPALRGLVEQLNEAIARLDDLVFGYQDYAVVARRAPA
jgi:O-antigen chain-terminating methyltransferase